MEKGVKRDVDREVIAAEYVFLSRGMSDNGEGLRGDSWSIVEEALAGKKKVGGAVVKDCEFEILEQVRKDPAQPIEPSVTP